MKAILFLIFSLLCSCPIAFASANQPKPALVLIDMQYGFYKRGGTLHTTGLELLVSNQIALLAHAVDEKLPVVILEYRGYDVTDTRLTNVLKGYGKVKTFQKTNDSGFAHPELQAQLKAWNVDTLIIAGVNGCCCVRSTVTDGLKQGYKVVTSPEVIGDLNMNPPRFPNGTWYPSNKNFKAYLKLEDLIDYVSPSNNSGYGAGI